MIEESDKLSVEKSRNSAPGVRFLVDVNSNFIDKVKHGDKRFWRFNMTFQTRELDARELLESIRAGYAWTAPHRKVQHQKKNGRLSSYRVKKNVISVQALALDVDTEDERSELATLAGDSFIGSHAAILHTSASHTPEAPRGRVIFVLSEAITVEEAELALRALMARYPYVDTSTKDASRLFYGAQDCEYILLDNVLDVELLRHEIIQPYQALQVTKQARRTSYNRKPEKANAGAVSAYITAAKWRILKAVTSAPAGTGERHAGLRDASVRLASFAAASWLTEDAARELEDWEGELLDAARASGYLSTYGEDEALRIIESGLELAKPAIEPDWKKAQNFFQPGDTVTVVRDKKVLVNGRIQHMRQAAAGHWEALINGVWYPRDWLRHDSQDKPPGDAGQTPGSAVTDTKQLIPVTPETAVECKFPPPPPDNFPPDWNEDEALASDFFAMTQDGRTRNIYAGLVRGEAMEVVVPEGEHLTPDSLPYNDLPRYAAVNANTGIGKTTYARGIPGQKIIATSSTLALEQILEREPTAHAYYHERKDAARDSELIVTTYESFQRLLTIVDASRFWLIVDEVHNFAASSSKAFRGRALTGVMDTMNGAWRGVTLMTGTPIPLCHPYLSRFIQVNVASSVRTQNAQRVVWKDKEGKGKRLDSVLELCDTEQKHIIYLNNKNGQLDRLVAGLVARGFQREQIAILNSDTKHAGAGRAIVGEERIPEGVRVLIVTHIAVEALNLRDTFDCVHIVSNIHPYLAQQLVNRLRAAAADIVYWYNAGAGAGYAVDVPAFQAHHLREARKHAEELNSYNSINPNDNSQEAILARSSMRRYQTGAGELLRVDEDVESGRKWYDVSYLGVDNAAFKDIATYTERNPTAWKNELRRYGWNWLEDRRVIVTKTKTAVSAIEEAIASELREEREKQHQERVTTIREHGDAWTREAAKKHEDVQIMKTAQQVASMVDAIKPGEGQQHAAFLKACELVEDANNSTRKLNRIRRQIKTQHLARAEDAFTLALMNAFTPGERLTSEDVHQRVLDVYTNDEVMELYARHALRYHFSSEPESRLTQRKAVEVLKDIYAVKRTSTRPQPGTEPIHVYEVLGQHEACEIVATLGRHSNKQRIVATTAPAFAFKTVATLPAAQEWILDWDAGEIPFLPEEVEDWKRWKRSRVEVSI